MEIFEPKNFFQMADLIANVLTGAVAIAGLMIALLTYKVANKALKEWKNQKNIEYLERFIKVFYKSRNFMYNLRNQISTDTEILEKHKKNFYVNGVLDQEAFNYHYFELIIFSRREKYNDILEELYELKSLAKIYVKNDSLITEYINYIIKIDKEVLNAARLISFYERITKDPNADQKSDTYQEAQEKLIKNKIVVLGMSNDDINTNLEIKFKKCEDYLSFLLDKYNRM